MNPNDPQSSNSSRREFLKSSSAAVIGSTLAFSFPRKSMAANSETIKIGLVGCGGRGSGAAGQALASDKNIALTAMGDVFEDQLKGSLAVLRKQSPEKVQVEPDKCFTGLDAYKKVIDSGVDVVLLATPPGFRPIHLRAAIAAGKHVFCEKPMAVDAPGVRAVLEVAEEARKKQLSLASGFCWRSHYPKREIFQRILDGGVGEINTIYSTYDTGPVKDTTIRKPEWTDLQVQLRNWYQFSWLCGDHIVEQAVHSLDMMAWAMGNVPPVRATANGGRQVRTSLGNIYDHFSVVYEYENGARGFHHCRQIAGCSNDYSVSVAGTKGSAIIDCTRGRHIIKGANAWEYPKAQLAGLTDMYQVEHNELFAAIRAGKPLNHGTWMAHSTLTAIMGRMAAYTGQAITWEQAMNSTETLAPANIAWDAPLPMPPPVPMPGKTRFV